MSACRRRPGFAPTSLRSKLPIASAWMSAHDERRAPRRLVHGLEVAERAMVKGDAQVAVGIELAAGEVRLARGDRIGHLEQVEVRWVRTQGVDGVGRAFVDEDFVAARGLQRRASLAQRVSAAQHAKGVDHVLDQLPTGSRGHLEPAEVGVKRPRPPGAGGNLGCGSGQHRPRSATRVVEKRRRHLALAVAVRQSERLAQHCLGGPAVERVRASEADDTRRNAARVVQAGAGCHRTPGRAPPGWRTPDAWRGPWPPSSRPCRCRAGRRGAPRRPSSSRAGPARGWGSAVRSRCRTPAAASAPRRGRARRRGRHRARYAGSASRGTQGRKGPRPASSGRRPPPRSARSRPAPAGPRSGPAVRRAVLPLRPPPPAAVRFPAKPRPAPVQSPFGTAPDTGTGAPAAATIGSAARGEQVEEALRPAAVAPCSSVSARGRGRLVPRALLDLRAGQEAVDHLLDRRRVLEDRQRVARRTSRRSCRRSTSRCWSMSIWREGRRQAEGLLEHLRAAAWSRARVYQLPPSSPWSASSAISRRKFIARRMLLSASPTAASKARVL